MGGLTGSPLTSSALQGGEGDPDTYPRTVGWCAGGAGVLLVNVWLLVVNPAVDITTPVQSAGLGVGVGAVAGFAIGANEARAISRGREAERGREILGFLNSTLRHEVLNNLNVVRGTATELAKESDPETERELEVIVDRCDDLSDLIADIRPIARTLTGRAEPTVIDLPAVVSERVDALEETYPDVRVTVDLQPETAVRAMEGLSHVLSHVLVNAVEHNDQETPRVEITLESTDEMAHLAVADNGPGVDDEKKERIFEPDTDRDRGFGLYMVQTVVAGFDGDIRVSDNDPRGSVFTIQLPLADAG